MRKKRNYLIYGTGVLVSDTEAKDAIKNAKELLGIIKDYIFKQRKQGKLLK